MEAIADFFNVSIDFLYGKSDHTTLLLTDEERAVIMAYRAQPEKRLAELEAEADDLAVQIQHAELKHPIIPEEIIKGWLLSFRSGDKNSPAFRKKLVETFVADVIVNNESVTVFYNIKKGPCSHTARLVESAKRCANLLTCRKPIIYENYIVLQVAF